VSDVRPARHVGPLGLDGDEHAGTFDDPVHLGTVGVAPEPDARAGAGDAGVPDQLPPDELLEELSEPLARKAPAFARGEPPDPQVEEQMPARLRELGAGPAARQGIDTFRDETVLENLVIAGYRRDDEGAQRLQMVMARVYLGEI